MTELHRDLYTDFTREVAIRYLQSVNTEPYDFYLEAPADKCPSILFDDKNTITISFEHMTFTDNDIDNSVNVSTVHSLHRNENAVCYIRIDGIAVFDSGGPSKYIAKTYEQVIPFGGKHYLWGIAPVGKVTPVPELLYPAFVNAISNITPDTDHLCRGPFTALMCGKQFDYTDTTKRLEDQGIYLRERAFRFEADGTFSRIFGISRLHDMPLYISVNGIFTETGDMEYVDWCVVENITTEIKVSTYIPISDFKLERLKNDKTI
jgi:hypothetical protein